MNLGKGLAVIGAAAICGYWMYLNHGVSGIGWFVLALIIIG